MTCPGEENLTASCPKGTLEFKFFFSGPAVILKLIQFANPVKRAEITWKQPCIVSREHKLENMLS